MQQPNEYKREGTAVRFAKDKKVTMPRLRADPLVDADIRARGGFNSSLTQILLINLI